MFKRIHVGLSLLCLSVPTYAAWQKDTEPEQYNLGQIIYDSASGTLRKEMDNITIRS